MDAWNKRIAARCNLVNMLARIGLGHLPTELDDDVDWSVPGGGKKVDDEQVDGWRAYLRCVKVSVVFVFAWFVLPMCLCFLIGGWGFLLGLVINATFMMLWLK